MSIFRCANCGSSRVSMDTSSEGFNVSKAFAGTILFGTVGAVMGVNGNKRNYYHCGACGVTLSYTMSDDTQREIDNSIANPQDNLFNLKWLKKSYPNIEWEYDSSLEKTSNISENIFLTYEEVANLIYTYCIDNNRLYIAEEELKNAIIKANPRTDESDYKPALTLLMRRGVATTEYVRNVKKTYVKIHTDPEQIKKNIIDFDVEEETEKLFRVYRRYFTGVLSSIFDKENTTMLTMEKTEELLAIELLNDGLTSNPKTIEKLTRKTISKSDPELMFKPDPELGIITILYDEDDEDDNDDKANIERIKTCERISVEAAKEKFAEKLLEYQKNKIPVDYNALARNILTMLQNDKVLVYDDFKNAGVIESSISFSTCLSRLRNMNKIEIDIVQKKTYYCLTGARERNAKKEREKQIAANNNAINSRISALQAEKARQQSIYEEFKGKIFGDGARQKKEAQQRIIQIDTEIANLKRQLR